VHVTQSSVDTTLSGDGVRTGREELSDTGGVQASLGKTEGGTKTSTTGSNDESIVLVVDNGVLAGKVGGSLLGAERSRGDYPRKVLGGAEVASLNERRGGSLSVFVRRQ